MVLARDVVGFETRGPVRAVLLDGSGEIEARAVLVATGVSYRRLEADRARRAHRPRRLLRRHRQRGDAVRGRRRVRRRRRQLGRPGGAQPRPVREAGRPGRPRRRRSTDSMSQLPRRPDRRRPPNIEVRLPQRGRGRARRRPPRGARPCADRDDRRRRRRSHASWLFVFIGASPRTDWLGEDVVRDDKGFVVTGQDLLPATDRPRAGRWRGRRTPWRRACPACSPPATSGSTR